MAEDKKMGLEDEKRLFAASSVSLLLVIFLCIVSFCAAKSHAGLPEYDSAGLDELMMMLDGEKWAVNADAKALLEKHLGLQAVQSAGTVRSGLGLDIVLYSKRAPYVLSVKKGEKRLEGVFHGLDFSAFILYEENNPVFCIFIAEEDVLIEFPAL